MSVPLMTVSEEAKHPGVAAGPQVTVTTDPGHPSALKPKYPPFGAVAERLAPSG